MILDVRCASRRWVAEASGEISVVTAEVLGSLQSWIKKGDLWCPGSIAWFSWSNRQHMDSEGVPNNNLVVSLNRDTGHGGLIWFAMPGYSGPEPDEVLDSVWISDNPNPPDFDTEVLSNPGEPYCFDPRSTLPAEKIEAAVDEFCQMRTGARPECVQWVMGELSGRRADGECESELPPY
ncbi:Imm1 family immunity protein [Streptomyces sp. NBC_00287]|uniref:Imm1 family immunity protein n=1 Tax=Streptomyces sp. NBC_00287 TaxID=2975702 RepID=UPI002E2B9A46|nr:Imm1 family immunity protein [Streptomyces sp. NBC_00287]